MREKLILGFIWTVTMIAGFVVGQLICSCTYMETTQNAPSLANEVEAMADAGMEPNQILDALKASSLRAITMSQYLYVVDSIKKQKQHKFDTDVKGIPGL